MINSRTKSALERSFKHQLKGIIWRSFISLDEEHLCIETKDKENYATQVSFINLNTFKLSSTIDFGENSWWYACKFANKELLFVEEMQRGNTPGIVQTLIYDISSGSLKNKSAESRFELSYDHIVQLNQKEEKENSWNVDFSDSKFTKAPIYFDAQSAFYEELSAFVKEEVGHETINHIEYLEYSDYFFVSYYYKANNKLNQNILSVNEQKESIKTLNVAKDLEGSGVDSFFVLNNHLIFAQENNTLTGYNLK